MADLSANSPRQFHGSPSPIASFAVDANLQVFAGSALLKKADGTAILCTPTASGQFLGFALQQVDNRTTGPYGGAAGDAFVDIAMAGLAWLTVANGSNWARSDSAVTVYASDSDTFTTAAGTNNIVVGKVVHVPEAAIGAASAVVLVKFEAAAIRSI